VAKNDELGRVEKGRNLGDGREPWYLGADHGGDVSLIQAPGS
jgi:hypothetical protein